MAEGVAAHQHSHPDPGGFGGQGGQDSPPLEKELARMPGIVEMITGPHAVEPQFFEKPPILPENRIRLPLGGVNTEPHSFHQSITSTLITNR